MSVVLVTGCDNAAENTHSWNFVNESSWEILISPNGESWSSFVLFPGDRRTVTLEQDSIHFVWWSQQGEYIYMTDGADSTWYFRNR